MLLFGFMAIGFFPGAAGVIPLVDMFRNGKILAGLLVTACLGLLGLCIFLGIALIKQVNDQFRSGGHSMERAGAEAGRSVTSNEAVRRQAKDAVLNAV